MSAAPFLSKSNNKRQYLSREKLRKNVFFRDFNKYPVSRRFDKNGATDMSFSAVSLVKINKNNQKLMNFLKTQRRYQGSR